MMMNTREFFSKKPIIGMVHLLPLPCSPGFQGSIKEISEQALYETQILDKAGIDAIIVENFGDEPFLAGERDPVQVALMARIVCEVKQATSLPLGVNVQFNAWKSEMAIAHACEADFIRVEVFVDTVISAMGMIHPCASLLTRYRKTLGAEVKIFADIQTKYTTNLLKEPLIRSAINAQEAQADAVIVTGVATGQETPLTSIVEVKEAVQIPVLAGSGTTIHNVQDILKVADGAIVGSALKEGGITSNLVSLDKCSAFMNQARNNR